MKSHKRVLKKIAKNYKLDSDELLITLWDSSGSNKKFDYLKNENSIIKNQDINFLKRIITSKLGVEKTKDKINKRKEPKKLIIKDYDFSSIGKISDPILHITKEEVLKIHEELTTDFETLEDPIYPAGLRDLNLLDSALFHPQTGYQGENKYRTIESVGAALMYSISNNHPFHNGNKRTAMVAMLVLLDRHNLCLTCNEDDLFRISIKLADHKLVDESYLYSDAEIHALSRWIDENSKVMKKGERPITLIKFKRRLAQFNCKILDNGKVERRIKRSVFGFSNDKILISKKSIGNSITDGSEVDRGLIKSIRDDLELNSENGIDRDAFYEEATFSSSEFIIKYKNLLKRLSKV